MHYFHHFLEFGFSFQQARQYLSKDLHTLLAFYAIFRVGYNFLFILSITSISKTSIGQTPQQAIAYPTHVVLNYWIHFPHLSRSSWTKRPQIPMQLQVGMLLFKFSLNFDIYNSCSFPIRTDSYSSTYLIGLRNL